MPLVGRADIDGIDGGIGKELADRRVQLRNTELIRVTSRSLRIGAGHCGHRRIRLGPNRRDHPLPSNRAGADQTPSQHRFLSNPQRAYAYCSARPRVGLVVAVWMLIYW